MSQFLSLLSFFYLRKKMVSVCVQTGLFSGEVFPYRGVIDISACYLTVISNWFVPFWFECQL